MSETSKELELNFSIGEKELVDLKMYCASQNKKINKQRKINRFVFILICIIISLVYASNGDKFVSTYFLLMGIICFILYPWYLNWLYRRVYRRQFANQNLPIHVWLRVDDLEAVTLANGITTSIPIRDINEIVELDEYFYLKITITQWITIPKKEVKNENEVRAFLTSMALVNNITYSEKKGFKWR